GGEGRHRGPAADRRSPRPQAGRMGDPSQRRERRRFLPFPGLHRGQSELAQHRDVPPAGRSHAVAGARRPRHHSPVHRRPAAVGQGTLRARPRAPRPGRAPYPLGGIEPAIAKARAAVNEKSPGAVALIEGLPSSADQDAGVLFSRIQLLRRADKIAEAAELMLAAPRDAAQIYDPDEWWVERRLIARKLLDLGSPSAAY